MPPGEPYADRQAMLCGNPGGCGAVVRREKGRRWNTLVCEIRIEGQSEIEIVDVR
ncbi:hypothetical protein DEO72_LG2g2309 [Vigna unguiculata]|uniref:Uncharacterized protein n=1 Tax=Vigna unguiculata TaxID=3917 RepID=A0A4D6KZF4_VIGUN|nr:hypothetical protein DEO72_LG2g2309 [Vigna unguiculata]